MFYPAVLEVSCREKGTLSGEMARPFACRRSFVPHGKEKHRSRQNFDPIGRNALMERL